MIDMHVHTNASDGIFSPTQIVDWAYKKGLRGVAITDHDTVGGILEAVAASKKYDNFLLIPGIEFSCIYDEKEVHVLGHFMDYTHKDLVEITSQIKEYRFTRIKKMIQKLKDMNISIEFEEVKKTVQDGSFGRPHIARILVQKGYADSISDAFEKFLVKGRPAFVERFKLSVKEAIHIIKKSRGIPTLAHPGLLDPSISIDDLIQKGFLGIEVYHREHDKQDEKRFLKKAKEYNLFITGGSDYHDDQNMGIPTIGSVGVSDELVMNMKNSVESL
ncbi:PHP domain-containing protein [Inediibacterium massiliense]|uniref:PHP domain-containing protein n=1 Tax=Inediibacterium massiliense TaxID=1658111 RepID=UPI000B305CFE|nr:PHP domain-containing protein [Inediibacterium massiliense]